MTDNAAFRFLMDKAQELDEQLSKVEARKKAIEKDLAEVMDALDALMHWTPSDIQNLSDLLKKP